VVGLRICFYASFNICTLNECLQTTNLEISNFIPTRDNRYDVWGGFILGPDITPERWNFLLYRTWSIPHLIAQFGSAGNGEASYLKTLSNAKVLQSGRQVYMSMQICWNDTDSGKPKFLKKKFSQYLSFNHKSHINRLSHGTSISTADKFHLCTGSDRTRTIFTEVFPWLISVHPNKIIDFFVLCLTKGP
jgi:hypothetical protein